MENLISNIQGPRLSVLQTTTSTPSEQLTAVVEREETWLELGKVRELQITI